MTVSGWPAFRYTADNDAEMVGFPSVAADTGRTSSAAIRSTAGRMQKYRVFMCIRMCWADIPIIINACFQKMNIRNNRTSRNADCAGNQNPEKYIP
jgi:hypothetical protein